MKRLNPGSTWSGTNRVVFEYKSRWSGTKGREKSIPTKLDFYTTDSRSARPVHDHYPNCWCSGFLHEYFWQSKIIVKEARAMPIKVDWPRTRLPSEPDQAKIAWSGLIELIWSAVGTQVTLVNISGSELSLSPPPPLSPPPLSLYLFGRGGGGGGLWQYLYMYS